MAVYIRSRTPGPAGIVSPGHRLFVFLPPRPPPPNVRPHNHVNIPLCIGPRVCAESSIFSFTSAAAPSPCRWWNLQSVTLLYTSYYHFSLFHGKYSNEISVVVVVAVCLDNEKLRKTFYRVAVCKRVYRRRRLDKKNTSCILYSI